MMSNERHGLSDAPEYYVWQQMKQRCLNPNNVTYEHYGGRGIVVCEAWAKSFTTFLGYMGRRPSYRHSIDRIDPDGNYEPGNVRWATSKVQNGNKRGRIHGKVPTRYMVTNALKWVMLSRRDLYTRIGTYGVEPRRRKKTVDRAIAGLLREGEIIINHHNRKGNPVYTKKVQPMDAGAPF